MRVLIAAAAFADALTAPRAAAAMAAGWVRQAPDDVVAACPLAGAGPGFLDTLDTVLDTASVLVTVTGPTGAPVPATVLLVTDTDGTTAYLETAQVCGRQLLPPGQVDPGRVSSAPVGELLRRIRGLGADRVVVALGGEASHDAGAGLLAALAGHDGSRLRGGGAALAGVGQDELSWLPRLRADLAGTRLVAVVDTAAPVLGFHGTSATTAEAKGASPQQAQHLERALGDLVHAVARVLGEPASARGPAARAGSGAGGGLGYGLALLGAELVPQARFALDLVGLADRVADPRTRPDLVLVGQACFDWRSLRNSPVTEIAALAGQRAVPVVVVAGQVQVGRREAQSIGVDAAYPVAGSDDPRTAADEDALAERVARVARTWRRLG